MAEICHCHGKQNNLEEPIMKKLLALVLVLAMVVVAFGCAKTTTDDSQATTTTTTTTTTPAEDTTADAADTTTDAAEEAEIFTVALILPMSSNYANTGLMMQQGAMFCYEYFLNEVGGFQSKNVEIEFLTLDIENNADLATTLFEKNVNDFEAVLGCYKTDATVAVGALATKYEKPFLITMSTPDRVCELQSDYVFRPTAGDTEVTQSLSDLFKWFESKDNHTYTQACGIFGSDDYGVSQHATLKKICDAYGWELNVAETVATGATTDASVAINKVKNSGADFCHVAAANAEVVIIQKQFKEYQSQIPVYAGGAGYSDPNYFANTGSAGDWVVCGTFWCYNVVELVDPATKCLDYVAKIAEASGLDFVETAGCAWMAMGCLLQGIEDAPTADPKDVAQAIKALDLPQEHFANLMIQYAGIDFEDVPGTVGVDLRYNQNVHAAAVFAQAQNNEWKLVYVPGAPEPDPQPLVWPHVPYGE